MSTAVDSAGRPTLGIAARDPYARNGNAETNNYGEICVCHGFFIVRRRPLRCRKGRMVGELLPLFLDGTELQQEPPASLQEIPHRSAQVQKKSPTNPSKPTSMDDV